MKKKVLVIMTLIFVVLCSFSTVYAATKTENLTETSTATELYKIKEGVASSLEEYKEQYGSAVYGTVAYILNTVRIYSIPLCFIGIVVGALYQYVLGTRRLDMKQKGFGLIILFITILVICQVLPLIFAIVVKGWRG